jgi:hypothetical protein
MWLMLVIMQRSGNRFPSVDSFPFTTRGELADPPRDVEFGCIAMLLSDR